MKRIVLIDDDQTTNALNKLIIEKSELVDEVVLFAEAEKALKFLDAEEVSYERGEQKSLILLDINMPIMNGWDFLEEYTKLNGATIDHKIVLLTSSIDPSDVNKAEKYERVSDYKSKPLSFDLLQSLVEKYLN
ncbi:MAG: response regulator [Cyclobacteriaceae bacterium]